MTGNRCVVCKNSASQTCSLCNSVYYCNREHQKNDWKNHKSVCAPIKIQSNSSLGRYIIATRDIKEGEIIMKKNPLIIGPKIASYPICLGCHKRLNPDLEFYKCSKCKWPLCNPSCEDKESHKNECQLFAQNSYVPQIQNSNTKQGAYAFIAPLRSLLLKAQDKTKYETILNMQSHLKENINTPLYKILRGNLIPLFQHLKIPTNEEEILTICSIFDTNAFEIRDTQGFINIRGLYPMVSLLSHDCKVNAKHLFHGDEHQIHVIATVDIKKGQMITITYTQTLWSTLSRRSHLKQSKNFHCTCKRCSDPTELGTYAGSITCEICKGKIISLSPLDLNSDWKCQNCENGFTAEDMININECFKREIYSIQRDPKVFEDFLMRYSNQLHPSNCHVLEVKYALVQMYGNISGYKLNELSDTDLVRKIELCEELLEIANILEPGSSRFRGNLLNELQETMVEKNKRDLNQNKINKDTFKEKMLNCMEILQKATEILRKESGMEKILSKNMENVLMEIHS